MEPKNQATRILLSSLEFFGCPGSLGSLFFCHFVDVSIDGHSQELAHQQTMSLMCGNRGTISVFLTRKSQQRKFCNRKCKWFCPLTQRCGQERVKGFPGKKEIPFISNRQIYPKEKRSKAFLSGELIIAICIHMCVIPTRGIFCHKLDLPERLKKL